MSENLYPAVACYKSIKVSGLTPGEKKYWCACGLSKNQPWCDGSHKGTGFTPIEFIVPELKEGETVETKRFDMCRCKYSKENPICDGTHKKLQTVVKERIENCEKVGHIEKGSRKLCTNCGFVPDF